MIFQRIMSKKKRNQKRNKKKKKRKRKRKMQKKIKKIKTIKYNIKREEDRKKHTTRS